MARRSFASKRCASSTSSCAASREARTRGRHQCPCAWPRRLPEFLPGGSGIGFSDRNRYTAAKAQCLIYPGAAHAAGGAAQAAGRRYRRRLGRIHHRAAASNRRTHGSLIHGLRRLCTMRFLPGRAHRQTRTAVRRYDSPPRTENVQSIAHYQRHGWRARAGSSGSARAIADILRSMVVRARSHHRVGLERPAGGP